MIIYVDIDGTICTQEDDYKKAVPIENNINYVNKLYDEGNNIIYWTARGTGSGIDWLNITKSQLKKWGVKYHSLKFGKPIYDLFIDDKNTSMDEIMRKRTDNE
jgi:dTDP-glucose 4,6-dehydratase